jgi:aminoglycoside 6'-N-acetyltransferase I
MSIRKATSTDKNEWVKMRSQLWPDSSHLHPEQIDNYFDNCSNDIVEALLIENQKAQVVGFIELNIRNFAEGSTEFKIPYVEGWFVRNKFRGLGFGKGLMLAAEQWAKDKGFGEIASDTEIDNHTSIAMHSHLGYTEVERVVCFLKKLS